MDKRAEAKAKLVEFAQKHNLNIMALGNGTACRETEEVIADVISSSLPEMAYVIVSEAGASVYSVSPVAKDEFPNLDAAVRSGASIGRRLQDPLSELVKIEPQHIGVGMYQHDVNGKTLRESLDQVIESCVNYVGVELNTASSALLKYVSGLNQLTARRIVDEGGVHIHIHARTREGTPSYEIEDFVAIRDAILEEVGDQAIINFSTGTVGVPVQKRIAYLEAGRPEVAALNMGSMNYAKY